jgi:hypothetical protein
MGFIEESGAAQHWRDSRIAPIYEGTNGIQAIDLVTRKIVLDRGATLDTLLDRVRREAGETDALGAVRTATAHLRRALADGRVNDALAGATPYLRMLGTLLGDWVLQRGAAASRRLSGGVGGESGGVGATHIGDRVALAEFYRARILPTAVGLLGSATAGVAGLEAIDFTR